MQEMHIIKYETSGPLLAQLRNSLLDISTCLKDKVGISTGYTT